MDRPYRDSTVASNDFADARSDVATVGRTPGTPGSERDLEDGYFETEPFPSAPSIIDRRFDFQNSLPPQIGPGYAPPSTYDGHHSRIPRQPSIRLRRRGSGSTVSSSGRAPNSAFVQALVDNNNRAPSVFGDANRPRSVSQPERSYQPQYAPLGPRHSRRRAPAPAAMPRLTEEGARPTLDELGLEGLPMSPSQSMPARPLSMQDEDDEDEDEEQPKKRLRKVGRFLWPGSKRQQEKQPVDEEQLAADRAAADYDEALVDYLDTIDPEVQTLSTLTNVQNSLFIPDLGKWLNRRPTYTLSHHDPEKGGPARSFVPERAPTFAPSIAETRIEEETGPSDSLAPPPMVRSSTISSRLTESHYAALPHGQSLEGWTAEEKWELDDHVRHMLHSRRSKFKRQMKGFGQYVRRPLGFFVTLWATLITLFGLAWVLFLIGWIYVGERQDYVVHIVDSVLVALFLVMGGGLAPFRAVDTYHMIFILRYAHIVKRGPKLPRNRLQKKNPPLEVQRSLSIAAASQGNVPGAFPDETQSEAEARTTAAVRSNDSLESVGSVDPEYIRANNVVPDVDDAKSGIEAYENTPLTEKQQKRLHYHQQKLANSHSFYKPNETFTHYAFPLKYLIAVVTLLDCHSCLQISLSSTTWGIDYHTRPAAITTVILCVSIACNITAGLVITIGDRKTRKKDVHNLMSRQELTGDAIKAIEEKREKDSRDASKVSSKSPVDSESDVASGSRNSGDMLARIRSGGDLEKRRSGGS